MKSQMTIGKKLMLAFCALLALTLGLAYSFLTSVSSLGKELGSIATVTARKLEIAEELKVSITGLSKAQRGLILFSMLKDSAHAGTADQQFHDDAANVDKLIAEIRPLLSTERGRQSTDAIAAVAAAWVPLYQEITRFVSAQRFDAEMQATMDKTVDLANQATKATADLVQTQRQNLAAAQEQGAGATSSSRWIAFILIALCLAVGAVGVFMVRRISSALREIASEMATGADQVAAAAGQVSSSSQSLAQGSSEQAASIEETSASSEEIHSMTQKNAENSRVAADNMTQASQRIEEANQNLDQMVVSMNEINASSDKISKIIKVIDEIAFQTNILALNAAVEAARAGEAGMGFAVVADEVRNLAQRCAQAAKDTAVLIEESIAKSSDGKNKLDLVATAVNSITESSNKVKTLVDEVKLGSEEQARGIEQVAKAITQMEKVSQSTAANAEESASASEELSAQSTALREVAGRLNGMVDGGREVTGRESHAKRRPAPSIARKPQHQAVAPKRALSSPKASKPVALAEFPMDEDFKEF
jgi:methyl-accepting chemotaxis protein/methyl-accepting chemotaxis protein-1 (serine sensor receptor)